MIRNSQSLVADSMYIINVVGEAVLFMCLLSVWRPHEAHVAVCQACSGFCWMIKIGFPLDGVIFKGFLCCNMLLIIMDAGLPKCSEQWMHLFCAGLVGPHYFQLLFVALNVHKLVIWYSYSSKYVSLFLFLSKGKHMGI